MGASISKLNIARGYTDTPAVGAKLAKGVSRGRLFKIKQLKFLL